MLTRKWKASFRIKLLLGISIVVMLSFTLSAAVSYRIHKRLFEEEVSNQYRKANEQAMTQLELRVQELYRISNYIVFNPTIEQKIGELTSDKEAAFYDQYARQEQIYNELGQVRVDAPQLLSLYLYDMNGNNYYHGLMKESVEPIRTALFEQIREHVTASNGQLVWMNEELPSRIEKDGTRETIIASRWMRNKNLGVYGMLVMVIDEEFITRSFREMIGGGADAVYLFDQYEQLIYTNDKKLEPGRLAELLQEKTNGIERSGGDVAYFTRSYSPQLSFTLVSRISMTDYMQKSRLILNVSLFLGLSSIVLSGVLIYLMSHRLLRPLKELVQAMRAMRGGRFDIRIEPRSSDELGFLADSFNAMAANVNSLIKEVYLRQISEREAELKALQAQLNPHFLYNSLNGLYWKLYLQDDKDTAGLIFSLSELLKYSLERVRKQTTLREELDQIRNYLKIQAAFLENDFEVSIVADDNAAECLSPRLLLQPLVENVFVHAFRGQERPKRLLIRAFLADSRLVVEIADNGRGMDGGMIQRIRSNIHGPEERIPLGIRSVIRRIDLLYGDPYRLEIDSEPDKGTTVRLLLPCEKPEERKEAGT